MIRDLRFSIRMLLKESGFTIIAVLTLALGIGATSAIFSLIQGVLLTPPPYRQPERLVLIPSARIDGQLTKEQRAWPAAQWMEWQKEAKSFESIAAYAWTFNFLVLGDGSQSIEGMAVSKDYFRVTGLQPVLGRTFLDTEANSRTTAVVIIGYNLWQRKFGGDRNIIGKTIRISRSDTPSTVVGVMPSGTRFLPSPGVAQEPNYNVNALVDYWLPAAPNPNGLKNPSWDVVGRLAPGVTPAQAQAELSLLAAREARSDPAFEGFTPAVQPLSTIMNREGNRVLMPLWGAAILVLLIACGNTAALLLVRGLQRQQEYAIRSALGSGRAALFRQVGTESLLLAILGGALGVGLAVTAVRLFKAIGGYAIPRLDAVTIGWPAVACGLGTAVTAAVLAGLLPALRASQLDPVNVLKSAGPNSSAGRGERRLLRGVTVFQTALTLSLLVGAGLLIRTMINVSKVQSGFSVDHILTMSVTAVQGDMDAFHHHALDRVSAIPGVEYAAFAWGVPLTGNDWAGTAEFEGQPPSRKASDRPAIPFRSVTPDYFKLLRLPVTQGREFRSTDTRGANSVAIVNQALADRYFPHSNPVGKKLYSGGDRKQPIEIVGVVANGRTAGLTETPGPEVYLSFWQARAFSKHLVVRTHADPLTLTAAIQRELRAVDPTVAVENVKTMEQIRNDSLAPETFAMQLLSGFSLVATLLTLVGIYGVLSLSVASRRREIAIRTAVGAGRSSIRNLVLADGFRLISLGLIIGLAASLILSRVLRSFLFGVGTADPVTLVCVLVLFGAVALFAFWLPAHRATRVDPLEALRYE
ncbi:MAG TPA: ABC transporter permease [Bryobacteraceae bacterium]